MKYKFFSTSEKAWDAMLADIKKAEQSVYLEMYIFLQNTTEKHDFISTLIEKAKSGVRVVLILDAVGSYRLPQKVITDILTAGGEILFYKQWFSRTHRKILIIDEQRAYLGGVNISQEYISWLDLHMRFDGAIVKPLLRSFSQAYRKCGGRDPEILKYDTDTPLTKIKMRLLEHWPGKAQNALQAHYSEGIRKAQRQITIVSPYFIPHPWLMKELEDARKRGVDIEVILPTISDPLIAGFATKIFVKTLHLVGIKFYFIPSMLHAKALIVDDEATVGSQNIDALSFDFNVEAGVFFDRKDMVRDLRKILDGWKATATLFDPLNHKHSWYEKIFAPVIRFIQPIL